MEYRTTTITTYKVDNRNQENFGGFVMYWKLYRELLRMLKVSGIKPNVFVRFFKFWWFCVLKPFGQFYTRITKFKGEYRTTNGVFSNINLVKSRTHKIFGIPVFYRYDLKLTQDDIEKLTK